ncbi:MAG TPA: DUF4956 domain-containing protein [Planctomycetes bacterium]|nr:DUF4956 domain-containing protein [Planctomycetota bacterium]HIL36740.1 DUF4956 domain-containing protein [Planctomycetota bacterium]
MEDFIKQLADFGERGLAQTGLPVLALAMAVSLVSSLFIAHLYRAFYQSRAIGSGVQKSFPLLGPSITAVFITIQFSLPLSLGLLGALSIVRFRTPIKEPEEIAFIMLVVAASLCCATLNMLFLVIILATATVALIMTQRFDKSAQRLSAGLVVVHVSQGEGATAVLAYLDGQITRGSLDSIVEEGDQVVISYSFVSIPESTVPELRQGLHEAAADAEVNLYFDQGATL